MTTTVDMRPEHPAPSLRWWQELSLVHVVGLMLAVAVATHVGRRDGVPTSLALLAGAAGAWSLLRHPAGAGLARPGTLAAALTGLTGLGILWADDRLAVADTTLSRVGAMAIGVAAAAIAARPGGLRWVSRGIQLGGAIVALTALAAELGAEVGRWGQTVSGRVQSVYADPNFLAQALVAVAVVSLNSFTIERRGWRLVAGVASLSSLAAIAFTESRGGVVGLAIGLLVLAALQGRRRLLGLFVVSVFVVGGLAASGALGDRFEALVDPTSVNDLEDADLSLASRYRIQIVGVDMWLDHWAIGVGAGNYPTQYDDYVVRSDEAEPLRGGSEAHNFLIESAAEQGLLGTAVFAALLWSVVAPAGRRDPTSGRRIDSNLGPIAGVAGWLGAGLFLHQLDAQMLWLLVGLIAGKVALDKSSPSASQKQSTSALGGPWIGRTHLLASLTAVIVVIGAGAATGAFEAPPTTRASVTLEVVPLANATWSTSVADSVEDLRDLDPVPATLAELISIAGRRGDTLISATSARDDAHVVVTSAGPPELDHSSALLEAVSDANAQFASSYPMFSVITVTPVVKHPLGGSSSGWLVAVTAAAVAIGGLALPTPRRREETQSAVPVSLR